MKIVFLVSALNHGGAERVATTLCNAWAARGDAVTLILTFSGIGQRIYEVFPEVEVVPLSSVTGVRRKNMQGYAHRLYALRRLILKREPDVIISFLPNVNVAAILSTAFLRIPLIICERTDPSSYPHFGPWAFICKRLYRFADVLTVQTDAVAAKVATVYHGLRKVHAIPNPLPKDIRAIEKKESGQRKVLLSLSRLSSEKQLDKLLRAFAEVVPQHADWDLHIYGDGPMRAALEKQIEEAGLGSRAILQGPTSLPWPVMASADAFVMVSNSEGFPNALLEAMGIGLPCAVFDCPSGPREITRDGKDALLIALNDHDGLVRALLRLMEDAELRSSLGQQARDSVRRRFSLTEVLGKWDRLFMELGVAASAPAPVAGIPANTEPMANSPRPPLKKVARLD